MTKSLLILAMDHDLHADAVHDLITQKGYSSFRLDPEADWAFAHRPKEDRHWFPSAEMQWHLNLDSDGSSSLKWYDQTIDLTNIGAVFCRNFQFARANAEAPIETHLKFSEMRAGLYGVLRSLEDCFWMNCPWLEDSIDNKMVQGRDAKHFGLEVPRTLVTNHEQCARDFIESCTDGAIIKQLSEISLIDDEPERPETYGFYTELISENDLKHLGDVKYAPCLFQESVPKKADIRATVVGDRIFAHSIDSQSNPLSVTDFRRKIDLTSEPFDFPEKTGEALVNMLKFWGMEFATCDFALTKDDRLIFFEANVTGNWLWLEKKTDRPILNEVVKRLSQYLQ